jgi:hypothetical protein
MTPGSWSEGATGISALVSTVGPPDGAALVAGTADRPIAQPLGAASSSRLLRTSNMNEYRMTDELVQVLVSGLPSSPRDTAATISVCPTWKTFRFMSDTALRC